MYEAILLTNRRWTIPLLLLLLSLIFLLDIQHSNWTHRMLYKFYAVDVRCWLCENHPRWHSFHFLWLDNGGGAMCKNARWFHLNQNETSVMILTIHLFFFFFVDLFSTFCFKMSDKKWWYHQISIVSAMKQFHKCALACAHFVRHFSALILNGIGSEVVRATLSIGQAWTKKMQKIKIKTEREYSQCFVDVKI